jgi:hypothetical protein
VFHNSYNNTLKECLQIEILSQQIKECSNVLPLAQKIVALNIDIKQLLVFDNIVNQLAKEYSLPPYVAALRLFNEIRVNDDDSDDALLLPWPKATLSVPNSVIDVTNTILAAMIIIIFLKSRIKLCNKRFIRININTC